MPRLSLYLLGSPQIELDGDLLTIRYSKALALLIYLAINGEPQRRDTLATLLWPESSPEIARSSLRRELSLLNKAFVGDWLVADRETIGLSADIWLDVAEFKKYLAELEHNKSSIIDLLDNVIKLYRSDFLTGFTLSNCPAFDEWQFFQTESLRHQFADCVKRLITELTNQHDYETAIPHARRWLAVDPLHEEAHRMLMRLYTLTGRQASALRQFNECKQLLINELGIDPDIETLELEVAIRERQLKPPNIEAQVIALKDKSGDSRLGLSDERGTLLGLMESKVDASRPTFKQNLPVSTTEFVGRNQEITDLENLLEFSRFVTILAPGGMGKTRLSIEVAKQFIPSPHPFEDESRLSFSDGVFFVPLGSLSSSSDLVTTMGENIGFVFHGESPPVQQLITYLKHRVILLVLDNFEHLIDGAELVNEIIKLTTQVRLIVTSRERLNLHGETVYDLRGLEFPTWETPEDAMEYDAVKLFMQSAKRVRSRYILNPEHLDFLARICRLTEGMPLGLELAAGWVDVLSLEKIANEIQRSIDILETDMRDIPERHRSLRAVFEQTWKRLTKQERSVFAGLSVFPGGFTLESTEAITGSTIRYLRKLSQKSLIQIEINNRFAIHELLRQFGAEKLEDTNESSQIQAKHSRYFADFMAERMQDIKAESQLEALHLIDADYDNVRVAWMHMVDNDIWEDLPKFLHSLWFYCDARSLGQDAFNLLQYAINRLEKQTPSDTVTLALSQVKARQAWFYTSVGNPQQGEIVANKALEGLASINDLDTRMFIRYSLGYIYLLLDKQEVSIKNSQEGLDIAQEIQDTYWEGHFVQWLGFAYVEMDDFDKGVEYGKRALGIHQRQNNHVGIKNAYDTLGDACLGLKQFKNVKFYYENALEVAMMLDDPFSLAYYHRFLGEVAIYERDYDTGMQHLIYSVRMFWDIGYTWIIPVPMLYIAKICAERKAFEKAIEITATLQQVHIPHTRNIQMMNTLYSELEESVEPHFFNLAWKRGQQRELRELVFEQLSEYEI
jgi:DNA-binding SARP family transcriptional activator/predicted ATPase